MNSVRNFSGIVACSILITASATVSAQSIVGIEEDWALNVIEPDQQLDSPQITTAILPFGANSGTVLYLDINHGSAPEYSTGGLQIRIEQNGETSSSKRLFAGTKLSNASETIKWTQVAYLQGNQLKFGITSGISQTWNYFGGTATVIDATVSDTSLDAYRHTDSLSNSGSVYAGNRVASLKLLRVRVINSLGQVVEIPINQSPL